MVNILEKIQCEQFVKRMTDANADIKTYPSLRVAPFSDTTSHEKADILSQAFISAKGRTVRLDLHIISEAFIL